MVTTNYILHLNNSFKLFTEDSRTTPFHISLYMALFHKWNNAKFRNPISVARDDLMYLSKIGSANTYIKCLKELDTWGYIKYSPSHSYHVGSKIYMYTFNTTKKTTTNNASDISINKTNNKASTQDVRPYKNIINNTNQINTLNIINDSEQSKNNSDDHSKNNSKSEKGEQRKKVAQKKESVTKSTLSHRAESRCERPLHEEVKNYFEQSSYPIIEADKFYNYFESNGWLVGGKTPMKKWQAAAKNWILNSNKFNQNGKNKQTPQQHHSAGKLHASTDKNFSEPL